MGGDPFYLKLWVNRTLLKRNHRFAGLLCHSGWRQTYIVCRIPFSTFGQNWPTLQCGLSAIAECKLQIYIVASFNHSLKKTMQSGLMLLFMSACCLSVS